MRSLARQPGEWLTSRCEGFVNGLHGGGVPLPCHARDEGLTCSLGRTFTGWTTASLSGRAHRPVHPVEVGDLPRADPQRQIREEEAIALGRVEPDQAEMERVLGASHMHIGIGGPAVYSIGRGRVGDGRSRQWRGASVVLYR
jgi:hypothetical protein